MSTVQQNRDARLVYMISGLTTNVLCVCGYCEMPYEANNAEVTRIGVKGGYRWEILKSLIVGRIIKKETVELVTDEITGRMVEVIVERWVPQMRHVEGCPDCRLKLFRLQQALHKTHPGRVAFLDLKVPVGDR